MSSFLFFLLWFMAVVPLVFFNWLGLRVFLSLRASLIIKLLRMCYLFIIHTFAYHARAKHNKKKKKKVCRSGSGFWSRWTYPKRPKLTRLQAFTHLMNILNFQQTRPNLWWPETQWRFSSVWNPSEAHLMSHMRGGLFVSLTSGVCHLRWIMGLEWATITRVVCRDGSK